MKCQITVVLNSAPCWVTLLMRTDSETVLSLSQYILRVSLDFDFANVCVHFV